MAFLALRQPDESLAVRTDARVATASAWHGS